MEADLLVKVGVVVAVLLVLWVLSDWDRYRDRGLRVGRVLHLAAPPPPVPTGPAIEQLAADAQRIRSQLRRLPPGLPVAKRRGWVRAYDDVLGAACQALGLEEQLASLPEGPLRDLERERIERLLERAGFLLRPSA